MGCPAVLAPFVAMERKAAVWRRVLAAVALMVLPQTATAQVTFVVDSTRSGMWVDAELNTWFGSDTDRDSTGLTGSLAIQIESETVRITSGTLNFADSLRFDFELGGGTIIAETEPEALSLEVVVPGPAADLVDGAFSQRENDLLFEGVLHLSGTGSMAPFVPDDPQEIATGSTRTMSGTLDVDDGTYQLTLPLEFEGSFDLGSGGTAHVALQATVHASASVASSVDHPQEQPSELVVQTLYPQPARERAHLALAIPQSQQVQVELFDVRGRRVGESVRMVLSAGRSELPIDVSQLGSGYYVAVVTGASKRVSVPLVVVR